MSRVRSLRKTTKVAVICLGLSFGICTRWTEGSWACPALFARTDVSLNVSTTRVCPDEFEAVALRLADGSVYDFCYTLAHPTLAAHWCRLECAKLDERLTARNYEIDMLTVRNQEVNDLLQKDLRASCLHDAWLGLTNPNRNEFSYDKNEWSFEWMGTTSPPNFTNWRPGEPANADCDEGCATLAPKDGFWNDVNCAGTHRPCFCHMENATRQNAVVIEKVSDWTPVHWKKKKPALDWSRHKDDREDWCPASLVEPTGNKRGAWPALFVAALVATAVLAAGLNLADPDVLDGESAALVEPSGAKTEAQLSAQAEAQKEREHAKEMDTSGILLYFIDEKMEKLYRARAATKTVRAVRRVAVPLYISILFVAYLAIWAFLEFAVEDRACELSCCLGGLVREWGRGLPWSCKELLTIDSFTVDSLFQISPSFTSFPLVSTCACRS